MNVTGKARRRYARSVDGRGGEPPLRAEDAFFLAVETPAAPQHAGAVIVVNGSADSMPGLARDASESRLAEHVRALPVLRHRLVDRGRWRWPAWQLMPTVRPADHVAEHVLTEPGDSEEWQVLRDGFFAAPLPLDRPPWQLLVVHGYLPGRTAVLAKLHHVLGDGFVVLAALVGLLADEDLARSEPPPTTSPAPTRQRDRPGWAERYRQGRAVGRGLVSLARLGTAPPSPLQAARGTSECRHRYATAVLDRDAATAAARHYGVSASTLFIAAAAEALHHLLDARHAGAAPRELQAMVPRTARQASGTGQAAEVGNRTAALRMPLPVAAVTPGQRLAEIAARVDALGRSGQAAAAPAVLSGLGHLPAPAHAAVARRIYTHRFFNVLISVVPGPRDPVHLGGAPVTPVYPILPLPAGVGLGIATLSWGDTIGVGVTAATPLIPDPTDVITAVREAFDGYTQTPPPA